MRLEPSPEDRRDIEVTLEHDTEWLILEVMRPSGLHKMAEYLGLTENFPPHVKGDPFWQKPQSRAKEVPITYVYTQQQLLEAGHRLGAKSLELATSPMSALREDGAAAQYLANQIHAYFAEQLPATDPATLTE